MLRPYLAASHGAHHGAPCSFSGYCAKTFTVRPMVSIIWRRWS